MDNVILKIESSMTVAYRVEFATVAYRVVSELCWYPQSCVGCQ